MVLQRTARRLCESFFLLIGAGLASLVLFPTATGAGWTFTEVVGGDLRTCSVLDDADRPLSSYSFLPSFDSCKGCLPSFTDPLSWTRGSAKPTCHVAADPLSRLEAGLRGLAGQQKAADKIKAALFRHTWDRPLAFHFAGESGVGKTSTVHLLARAIFADEDLRTENGGPPPGLLVLDGEYFDSKASDKIEEYRDHISREVVGQLQRCPRSIIVFDELDLVDPRTLAIMEPFLDKRFVSYKGQSASCEQAIFVFISNSGALAATLTDEEADAAMRASLAKAWGNRKKMGSLVQNMIPFHRLDEPALRDVMRARLEGLVDVYGRREGLLRVCFSHRVLAALVDEVLRNHPQANARGVDLVFNPKVVEPLLAQVQRLGLRARLIEERRKEARNLFEQEEEEKGDGSRAYDDEGEDEGGTFGGMWRRVKRPLGAVSARVSRTSSQASSYLLGLVRSRGEGGEWRGEFEASLYFPKDPEAGQDLRPTATTTATAVRAVLMAEIKELTTGKVAREEVSQLDVITLLTPSGPTTSTEDVL